MKRTIAVLICLVMALGMAGTVSAQAEKADNRVVRVGWYDSPFNRRDDFGRRSGYAYDYQQKIAAYTGWTYEYVERSWPELLQMLMNGTIDMLSDVSYTEERAEQILYSNLPMGTEEYYVYISPKNDEISQEDFSTFNGKKVGINKGSVQVGYFRDWAAANSVQAEVIELTCTEEESREMLDDGKLDMIVSMDGFDNNFRRTVPVCKVGASEFYFAVSRDKQELLAELNAALERIQTDHKYYNQQLEAQYLKTVGANSFLSSEEKKWLSEHGTIRVGYQDNYLAFCAKDPKTGELTGALKDYLDVAADCLENAHLDFEAVAYPTADAAIDAMKNGEVDCMFPANLTDYDCETRNLSMTTPILCSDMSAVVRKDDQKGFAEAERVVVAVNQGNPNYDMFLEVHFPQWRAIHYTDTPACLKAVAEETADCILISNYRYNNIAKLCEKYDLVTVSTGVALDYGFAVNREDTILYSILSKTAGVVPDSTVNAALSYYFTEDARNDFGFYLKNHMGAAAAVLAAVLLVISLLVLRSVRAEKKASADKELISATEFDHLTGLYNRSYFYEFANRMYRENPDRQRDAIVLNIDRFHAVNAAGGRELGDRALHDLGDEIRAYLNENDGIAGRSVGDHFAIYCLRPKSYQALFDRLQGRLDGLEPKTEIRLRMGVMPWQENMEPTEQFEHAQVGCNMARGQYGKRLIILDERVRDQEEYEQRLQNDLRNALKNREFAIYYQPKYDIQAEPPVLKSAEALVRWQHPEFGLISPKDFIPLFERSGQIGMLDKYVWEEAARQVAAWREKYGVTLPVSVNLSRVDVLDPTLEETLERLTEENRLDSGALKLEVTESACTENAKQVIAVIKRLREKGFEIEIDDFGTGYSSLNMLTSMPVDVLKMDREFVRNMDQNEKDIQMVELILELAKKLKVPVIAEGVETEKQLQMLRTLGCALVQGYYFSRPLPAEEFEKKFLAAV